MENVTFEIRVFEDWIFVRLWSLVLASEWTTNQKKFAVFYRSIYDIRGGDTLTLSFTIKKGQSAAQNIQKIFYFDFTSTEMT